MITNNEIDVISRKNTNKELELKIQEIQGNNSFVIDFCF